jgi:hypothetical protein
MRLADLIREESGKPLGQFFRDEAPAIDHDLLALEGIPDALPVYVADAICEHLFAETAQEVWDLSTDFPRCLPLHPNLFLEMVRPSTIRSEAYGLRTSKTMPHSSGWFICWRDRAHLPIGQRSRKGYLQELCLETLMGFDCQNR